MLASFVVILFRDYLLNSWLVVGFIAVSLDVDVVLCATWFELLLGFAVVGWLGVVLIKSSYSLALLNLLLLLEVVCLFNVVVVWLLVGFEVFCCGFVGLLLIVWLFVYCLYWLLCYVCAAWSFYWCAWCV